MTVENGTTMASQALAVVFLLTVLLIGIWDVFSIRLFGPHSTVSDVLQTWSKMYPILPLTVGLILGHIFWPVH
jgi:hypothetical protein